MVWNKDLPDGNVNIALGDDAIRANNAQLETALDLEHSFTTGGDQTGRHTFTVDTTANVLVIPFPAAQEGGIAFSNNARAGNLSLYVYDGGAGAWVPADCAQADIPRTDEQSQYTTAQFANMEELTVGTGEVVLATPDTVTIDLERSNYRYITLAGDSEFSGFTNDVANYSTTITVELTQSTPASTVTFAAVTYETPYGLAPVIGNNDGEKTVLQFIKQTNGKWLIVTSPAVAGI